MTDKTLPEEPIHIHRHHHAAPPLLVSDTTAEREGFPSARAWRKFARAAAARGLPVAELGAELAMAREDVLAALRGAAPAAPTPTVEPADDFESATLAAAASAGLKLVGGRR
jgi:hypothetical protein